MVSRFWMYDGPAHSVLASHRLRDHLPRDRAPDPRRHRHHPQACHHHHPPHQQDHQPPNQVGRHNLWLFLWTVHLPRPAHWGDLPSRFLLSMQGGMRFAKNIAIEKYHRFSLKDNDDNIEACFRWHFTVGVAFSPFRGRKIHNWLPKPEGRPIFKKDFHTSSNQNPITRNSLDNVLWSLSRPGLDNHLASRQWHRCCWTHRSSL